MIFLVISFLPLIAAPFVYHFCARRPSMMRFLDGFIFAAVGGLLLAGVLPDAFADGGWRVAIFLLLGLILPVLSERILHHERRVHRAALVLGLSGLVLHAITDGAALTQGHDDLETGMLLSFSVLLHRLPIALTLWWLTYPRFGAAAGAAMLALIGASTTLGYALGQEVLAPMSSHGLAFFQAFVAGSLMHVLVHRPHARGSCDHGEPSHWSEGMGNLLGIALVVYLAAHHATDPEHGWLAQTGQALLGLSLESAPALLLAYLIAGIAVSLMPAAYVGWLRSGGPWRQALRGVAVGLPLPVCSCGVVPLYATLIKQGAPATAAMAFLIATPELGIDAVLLSLPLLGAEMTTVRVAAAVLVALAVGVLVGRRTSPPPAAPPAGCCSGGDATPAAPWHHRLGAGLRYGLGELVDHTGPWIVAGLLIAALVQPLLTPGMFAAIPAGLSVPAFALLGMPVYVCAAGATPVVAVFLASGVSPGAALAFLITGPATNLTTLGVLSELHGRRTALAFGAVTFSATVGLGYLTDGLLRDFQPLALQLGEEHASTLQWLALAGLAALYLYSLLRRGARAFLLELFSPRGLSQPARHQHSHH